ncbi:MAG: ABC transporter permease subunit [Chloroflexia bacterium]|nr:ABC transporter permease subunit [Chloroflexia bacterium]
MRTLTIARLSFQEARQRKLLWIIVLIGLAFLVLYAIGFLLLHREVSRHSPDPVTMMIDFNSIFLLMGLYVVNFLGIVLTVLTSAGVIAGEIASGTIQTIVTKPLRRWEVILGKWLGLAAMLSAFILVMSVGLIAIVWLISGYLPPQPLQGVPLIVLGSLVLLSLSILGGTRLSTLANGTVMFMLYGLTFVGGWIEQIGAFIQNEAMVNTGIVVSLLVPAESMWKRAAYLMQPPFLRDLGISPFASASAPSPAMVAYTGVYIAVVLLLALRSFQRRDL